MTKTDEIMAQVVDVIHASTGDRYYAEKAKLRAIIEDVVKGHARYEHVRMLNAREFSALYRENITTGVPFDDLVDRAILIEGNVNEN